MLKLSQSSRENFLPLKSEKSARALRGSTESQATRQTQTQRSRATGSHNTCGGGQAWRRARAASVASHTPGTPRTHSLPVAPPAMPQAAAAALAAAMSRGWALPAASLRQAVSRSITPRRSSATSLPGANANGLPASGSRAGSRAAIISGACDKNASATMVLHEPRPVIDSVSKAISRTLAPCESRSGRSQRGVQTPLSPRLHHQIVARARVLGRAGTR
uniref:Uncharacterized protein n=1 Tax=Cafeteria roenbergensis TaxID=33653 RepID=A0A7S0K2P0_CAFRO|mmetsp:Transcript_25886/g.97501  ORF Transcript_25886/g.97501 Transcript_25886/m.97501 type:complete len:219 (+) Transcript_25886:373-1029(+)